MSRPEPFKTGRAYLLAKINTLGYPHIDHVMICSERNPTTIGDETYALILEVAASSYEDAARSMRSLVQEHTHYKWVMPLLVNKF